MDLLDKQLSPESSVKIVMAAGKISLIGMLDTKGLDLQVVASVDSDYFFDELAKKIPGQLDDAIIAVLKATIKAL